MNEHQAREHVKKLRRFYTDALIYGAVNLGLVLIWAIAGGGYFWPIWVIVGWGIGLGVHAFSLGLLPQVEVMIPFMTPEWEEDEVKRLMKSGQESKKTIKPTVTAHKEVEIKEVAKPKPVVKPKAAVKPKPKPKSKPTPKK
ncbi:MAG: 2TM domain-containing protein [Proteobacteria bacterium]|nr:2TM domain-containing protein [Pseudomonadota bacterium]